MLFTAGCGPKGVPEKPEVQAAEPAATTPATTPTAPIAETPDQEAPDQETPDQAADIQETAAAESPSLGEQLAALAAQGKLRMPPETVQIFSDGIAEVRESGIVENALSEGDQAVDATLPDAQGEDVKLSDLWASGPVVVVWYRGGWCPYCNLQLRAMQEALPAIREAGATLVAITPETPDNSLSTSEKNELEFTVLSDVGNELARQYGVVFTLAEKVSPIYKKRIDLEKYNGNDSDELPLAATYVIDTTGKIRYAFLDADYTKRAEPADVLAALEAL